MNPGPQDAGQIYIDEKTSFSVAASSLSAHPEGAERYLVALYAFPDESAGQTTSVSIQSWISETLRQSGPFREKPDSVVERVLIAIGFARLKRELRKGKKTGPVRDVSLATDTWDRFLTWEGDDFQLLETGIDDRVDRQILKRRILLFLNRRMSHLTSTQLTGSLDALLADVKIALSQLEENGLVLRDGDEWCPSEKGRDVCTSGAIKTAIPFDPKDGREETVGKVEPKINSSAQQKKWDVFISHSSEDKVAIVKPLAIELKALGLKVWYDEWELTIGDGLRRKIDKGLSLSRYGIVVLSHSFFAKEWPQDELDGLVAREHAEEQKVILPVWHELSREEVTQYSPLLAGKLAGSTEKGIEVLAHQLKDAMNI